MKNQALFSAKDKSKKLKCCLLQFLFGALRVKRGSAALYQYFKMKIDRVTVISRLCLNNFQTASEGHFSYIIIPTILHIMRSIHSFSVQTAVPPMQTHRVQGPLCHCSPV